MLCVSVQKRDFLIKEIPGTNLLMMPEIAEDCLQRADCEAKSLYLSSSLKL